MSAALARRVAASRKAAASRKRLTEARAAAVDRFMADGTPVQSMPPRGTARGDFSPSELLARIREKGG